jgi:RNA polymerase sigma factor (sigma-70 family)
MRSIPIPAPAPAWALRPKRLLVMASDDRLVEQIRRGNEAAFEVVFERHGPGILGFCRHMLGRPDEAEDAVQHTFAAAFRALQGDDRRELALKPWLYAIARNRCSSILRSRREQLVLGDELATAGLAEQVERRAELRELVQDLRELPEEQRAALLLAEAGGLSHTDVADVLGCEVARVKALVFRARSGLIQRREARETACGEIREQLANLSGGSLRRSELRHHLRVCAGCRDYREQVKRQRRMLASVLPVAPSLGLKSSVLAAIGLGGGAAGGGLATGLAGLGGGVAKLAAVTVVAGGAVVGGDAALDSSRTPPPPKTADVRPPQHTREQAPPAPVSTPRSEPGAHARGRLAVSTVERPARVQQPARLRHKERVQHPVRGGRRLEQRPTWTGEQLPPRAGPPAGAEKGRGNRVDRWKKPKASPPRMKGPPAGKAHGPQAPAADPDPGRGAATTTGRGNAPLTRGPAPKHKAHQATKIKKPTHPHAAAPPAPEPVVEPSPKPKAPKQLQTPKK